MADEQALPEEGRESVPPPPPVQKAPVKKAPVKKAPAKKAAAKKAPAKKAPVKKAPATKAPAEQTPVAAAPAVAGTNGSGAPADGPKQAAAQAKDTVQRASDTLTQPALAPAEIGRSPVPVAMALVLSIVAFLLVRQLRRGGEIPD
jgi:hypothetical protein